MDAIEIEALLLRHEAAMRERDNLDLDGLQLLAWVVMPTPELRDASLTRAREKGPRPLVKRLLDAPPADTVEDEVEVASPHPWGARTPLLTG